MENEPCLSVNVWRTNPVSLLIIHYTFSPSVCFAFDDSLYIVEFVESFERGEGIDVEVEYLVADLAQDRVVELEDAELSIFVAWHLYALGLRAADAVARVVGFEFAEDLFGSADDGG